MSTQTTSGGTVVGVFKDPVDAQRAVKELCSAGFIESTIGVVSDGTRWPQAHCVSDEAAVFDDTAIKPGRTIVTVKAENRSDTAREILSRFGSQDPPSAAAVIHGE